jgi:catechol 2,3-dioxygenase-like lactoylglutathione lyase family enzyme
VITGVFHAGVTVSDLDRSLVFYRDGLGLDVELETAFEAPYIKAILNLEFDRIRAVCLRVPGGGVIELLEYQGIERLPAASRPCDPGSGHLSLCVDDLAEQFDRLTALGFRARSEAPVDITAGPNRGARNCYFADPDGYWIEILEQRPGA